MTLRGFRVDPVDAFAPRVDVQALLDRAADGRRLAYLERRAAIVGATRCR